MIARRCRQADLWMAALEAGTLDDAERIRLQEHLEGCARCARRARDVSRLVSVLRAQKITAEADRLNRLWRRVNAGRAAPAPSSRRGWRLVAAGGFVMLGIGIYLAIRPAIDNTPPIARAAPPRVIVVNGPVACRGKPLVAGQTLREGDRLVAGVTGRVVLSSATRVLILEAGALALDRAGVRLERGALSVCTQGPAPEEERVLVAGLVLRPVGTTFTVERSEAEPPRVMVFDGRVEVSLAGREILVSAGSVLRWGEPVRQLDPAVARRARRSLQAARRLAALSSGADSGRLELGRTGLVEVDDLSVGHGPVSVLLPAGRHQVTLTTDGHRTHHTVELRRGRRVWFDLGQPASRPVSTTAGDPEPSQPRVAFDRRALDPVVELRAIEGLLRRGQAAEARARARRCLRRPVLPGQVAALLTLVAESHVQQARYRAARDVYLRLHRQHGGSPHGADALYMVGSLELGQLEDLSAARRRFERYLSRYRRGKQREGAHHLLHQALVRLGQHGAAQAVARRYLAEFPDGQYAGRMRQSAGGGGR